MMQKPSQPASQEWCAWAAGIIDGEGWISVFENRTGNYRLEVGVNNTDPRMCRKLLEMFGGNKLVLFKTTNPKHRPFWKWQLLGRNCKPFLQAVLPYLVCKKDQAEIALCFIETVLERKNAGGKYPGGDARRTPDDTLSQRREMYLSLRALKAEVLT